VDWGSRVGRLVFMPGFVEISCVRMSVNVLPAEGYNVVLVFCGCFSMVYGLAG